MTTETAMVAFSRQELLAWPFQGRCDGLVYGSAVGLAHDGAGPSLGVLAVDIVAGSVELVVLGADLGAVCCGDEPAAPNLGALGADSETVGFGYGVGFGRDGYSGSAHRGRMPRGRTRDKSSHG